MNFCPSCGQALDPEHQFCPSCGTKVETAAAESEVAEDTSGPILPPAAASVSAKPSFPFDPMVLVRGNWVAAGLTAGTALAVGFLTSLVLIFVSSPTGLGIQDKLAAATAATAAAVSVNAVASSSVDPFPAELLEDGSSDGDTDEPELGTSFELRQSLGVVPLLISILSIGAAIVVFRRRTRGYHSIGPALADAARAGFVYGLGLLVLAVVFRSHRGEGEEDMWGPTDVDMGASRASALWLGWLLLFAFLALSCFLRRDWLGERAARIHSIVVAPIAGITAFVLALPAAGVIAWVAFLATADSVVVDQFNSNFDVGDRGAAIFASLGNAGLGFVGVGGGARVGAGAEFEGGSDFLGDVGAQHFRLSSMVDQGNAWGLWLAIPTMLLLLGLACWVMLRRVPAGQDIRIALAVWFGGLFVFLPWLTYLASVHVTSGGTEGLDSTTWAGVPGIDAWLLALLAIPITLLLGWRMGRVDLKQLASAVQYNPAEPPKE